MTERKKRNQEMGKIKEECMMRMMMILYLLLSSQLQMKDRMK
jgi:hypothetical protein